MMYGLIVYLSGALGLGPKDPLIWYWYIRCMQMGHCKDTCGA